QQHANGIAIAIKRCVHDWCPAAWPFGIHRFRVLDDRAVEFLAIAVAKGTHYVHDRGIYGRGISVARQRVRPVSALIDPVFDDIDLLRPQVSRRGHLSAELGPAHPAVERTPSAIARNNTRAIRPHAVWHRVSATVETEAAHLLRGPVAFDAVFPQYRLNITGKVQFGRSLGSYSVTNQAGEDDNTNCTGIGAEFGVRHSAFDCC